MKARFYVLLTTLATLALPAQVLAKGPTTRITVKGSGLATPIEITDARILADFNVWGGPGTTSNEPRSLIIDWSKGIAAEPSKALTRYEVSFYAKHSEEALVYVVSYCYDPAAGRGYVYLPGKTDQWYSLNVRSILHYNEGNWFQSWRPWDETIRPLIEKSASSGAAR